MPRAIIDGDPVRFTNLRNFIYWSRDDFDAHYEERDVSLAHLVSLDLFVSYWKIGPVAHTFVSFNFDDGSLPVCISIETRPEIGEGFDPIASMFKQVELIYVVGDERDIVRVRTDYRDEDVFLYPIRATPDQVRRLFRIYLDRINQLADHPEWYHLLSNSCTVNIIRYSRAAGGRHSRFEFRHLLNGLIDRYVYGWASWTRASASKSYAGARTSTTPPAPLATQKISRRGFAMPAEFAQARRRHCRRIASAAYLVSGTLKCETPDP